MSMKRISTYLILLFTTLVAGCEMDQYPYSEIASEDYVKDAAAVNTLVIGAYNGLHGVMYHQWSLTELRSDNARMRVSGSSAQDTKLIEQLDQGTIGTAHDWVGQYWDNCYATINRTNMVLAHLDVVSDPIERAQYEAEALFLRSLLYFDMIRLYGPVFLVTKQIGADEARNMQRSPIDEVYAQIEGDLERIVNEQMLPIEMPAAQTGRATLVAAKALLAKVYLTHYEIGTENYLKARTLLREVLATVGDPKTATDLVPYAKIFAKDNEMNKEIIFAVRYLSGNVGLGSPFTTLFGPLNNGNSVVLGSPKHYNYPSDNLLAAYNANQTDLRKAVVIAEGYTNITTGDWKEERYMVKYLDPEMATEWDGENDWPVLRVGDVLLLLAEVINEVDGPTDEALTYLNMIRERAGIPAYTATELASRYQFREAVRAERRLELAFENHRWFDLLRWNIATTTVNAFLAGEAFYAEYNYTVNPIADWQTLLPIPLAVININPDVAQNVGY